MPARPAPSPSETRRGEVLAEPEERLLQARFLHPRYWPVWLALGLLRVLVLLPQPLVMAIGRLAGRAVRPFTGERRTVMEANVRLCFPEWSDAERAALVRRHFEALGMGVLETAMSWWSPDDKLMPLVEVEGREHLREAMARGRGVILLSGHFTSLELGCRFLRREVSFRPLYREDRNPLAATIIRRARRRHVEEVISNRDMRGLMRALRDGHAVWYAPDQSVKPKRGGVFARFFGIDTASPSGTARLARSTGAAVVPFFPERLDGGRRYRIVFEPALEDFPGEDDLVTATARINEVVERWVRRNPEQYFWGHRRFKLGPEGKRKHFYR